MCAVMQVYVCVYVCVCVCVRKYVGGGRWDLVMKQLAHDTQKYNLALEEAR